MAMVRMGLGLVTGGLLVLVSSLALGQGLLLPNAKQQFLDSNGSPLAGGFVFTYVPGTTTPSTTWQDPGLTVPNTNPVLLDSAGEAQIWAKGSYRQVVTRADSSLVWDQVTKTGLTGPVGGSAIAGRPAIWVDSTGTNLNSGPATQVDIAGNSTTASLSSANPLYLPTYSQLTSFRNKLGLSGSVTDSSIFTDGFYSEISDSDTTVYTQDHGNIAGRFGSFGPNNGGWQTTYKSLVGVSAYGLGATTANPEPIFSAGVAGILAEGFQFGAGIGDNELSAQNPSAAAGGIAQAKSLAGVQAIIHNDYADNDLSHTAYAVIASLAGTKRATAAFGANDTGGHAQYFWDPVNTVVTTEALIMPGSATGNYEGTIIDYGLKNGNPTGGSYTRWVGNVCDGQYQWIDSGVIFLTASDTCGVVSTASGGDAYFASGINGANIGYAITGQFNDGVNLGGATLNDAAIVMQSSGVGSLIKYSGTQYTQITPSGAFGFHSTNGALELYPTAFANLPSSPSDGGVYIAAISDSNTNVDGATVAGGGSNKILAWFVDGSWVVIGVHP